MGDPRPRHGRRARHHGRLLSDQSGGRGRVPARRLRGLRPPRRGPGAVRQGRRRSTAAASATCARSCSSSRAAWSAPTTTACCSGTSFLELGRAAPASSTPTAVAERMAERPRRRRDDARLHVGHDRPAQGGDAHQPQLARSASTSSSTRTARVPGGPPTPDDQILTYLPLCHVAERIFSTWTVVGGRRGAQLRRVDRDRQREPPRGAADVLLRRAAHLGEAARGLADQGQRRHLVQEAHAAVRARPGATGSGGSRSPTAASTRCRRGLLAARRLGDRVPADARAARPAALPLRRFGRGADRARGARVLHRPRRPGLRAVRHDRELGDRHRQLRRPHEARHGRRAVPRHRLPDRRGDRRDPGQARRRVRRLLEQAREDAPRRSPTTAG